jgi:hypothetical protein
VIAVVLTIVIRLLRRNWRDIWPGVRNGVLWVQVAVLAVLSAVISKTIDGAGRKLQGFGISLSETAEFRLAIVEEILELGFGVLVSWPFVCSRDRRTPVSGAEAPLFPQNRIYTDGR